MNSIIGQCGVDQSRNKPLWPEQDFTESSNIPKAGMSGSGIDREKKKKAWEVNIWQDSCLKGKVS